MLPMFACPCGCDAGFGTGLDSCGAIKTVACSLFVASIILASVKGIAKNAPAFVKRFVCRKREAGHS